jgi:hypothetical protein
MGRPLDYVHTYVCTRVCVFVQCVCVFTWSGIYLSTFLCVFLVLYGRMCVRTPVHVSVCMCVCVRGCTRTCVSVCACMGASLPVRMCVCDFAKHPTHILIYTHTHTHTHSNTIWVWTSVLPSWLSRCDRPIPPQGRRNKWRVTRCRLA